MSGVPPHHTRPVRAASTAWKHLQVPNFFPRAPQLAHIPPGEHPLVHQPTWHTPTTSELPLNASHPYSHVFNLEQMLSEPFKKGGVDLSVSSRSATANGGSPTSTPLSLSVRDTHKINSLAVNALKIQEKSLQTSKKSSPSPPPPPATEPVEQSSPKIKKKRVDSILERLNPQVLDGTSEESKKENHSNDENSNSSGLPAVPGRDELSPCSNNEDSVDSNKSRRKRKPSKTLKVTACCPEKPDENSINNNKLPEMVENKVPERRKEDAAAVETIDKIAAMVSDVQSTNSGKKKKLSKAGTDLKETEKQQEEQEDVTSSTVLAITKPGVVTLAQKKEYFVAVEDSAAMVSDVQSINSGKKKEVSKVGADLKETEKQHEELEDVSSSTVLPIAKAGVVTLAQKKEYFVAVEDKLEEMFAGLEEADDSKEEANESKNGFENTEALLETVASTSQQQQQQQQHQQQQDVTSSNSAAVGLATKKKANRKTKKQKVVNSKGDSKKRKVNGKTIAKNSQKKATNSTKNKADVIRDIYAYDSGSNASSGKSRGPFVHISGPRDSPINVAVINAPQLVNEEDGDRRSITGLVGSTSRSKKFHDDSDYRSKVRSKGLHCSTLSHKYDAQTKDASWICVFCKRGPYSAEYSSDSSVCYTPGDLFGPYIIGSSCAEYERRLDDPFDKQFKSKKIARSLGGESTTGGGGGGGGGGGATSGRKSSNAARRKTISECEDPNVGIVPLISDQKSFEIWAHEDCVVWAPGIYLIGAKIVGLEEAVWACSNVQCTKCALRGANVCCLRRGCPRVMHLGCARLSHWHLDQDNYRAFCPDHKLAAA